ncbi:hypothetical protein MTO96_029478 [Rhipicephalus appendiculatus]
MPDHPDPSKVSVTMIILLASIVASVLGYAFNFLNEWLLRRRTPTGSKLPPMPPATSIRGHVELLRPDFHQKKCIEWAKEYGPVFRLKTNFLNVVILNDFENIKKFCSTKEILWRSHSYVGYRENYRGLGQLNGQAWTANKRYCLYKLRDLGFAKTTMEGRMMQEFRRVADSIGNANGKPLYLSQYVLPCTLNNIVSFFYGGLLTHDHPTRSKLHRLMHQGYIRKIEESKEASDPSFTDNYLVGNVNSFLMAGTFSTTLTMTWQMINFAKYPDTVQTRVQREIDEVIGQDRMPTWEDRKRMPYTMACMWEVERWKTAVPLGVPRE